MCLCWRWLRVSVSEPQRERVELSLCVKFAANDVLVCRIRAKGLVAKKENFRWRFRALTLCQPDGILECDGRPFSWVELGFPCGVCQPISRAWRWWRIVRGVVLFRLLCLVLWRRAAPAGWVVLVVVRA